MAKAIDEMQLSFKNMIRTINNLHCAEKRNGGLTSSYYIFSKFVHLLIAAFLIKKNMII